VRPKGPLVLVVEAVDAVREAYSSELAAAGFMVLEAVDGASAIEKAARFGPHAVILDLGCPGIDGFKVARRIRAVDAASDLAILALGEPTHDKLDAMALAAGCDAFMRKPVLGAALVGEVVRLLAAKRVAADAQGKR
jgi:two-component system response regulator MprA